MHLPGIEHPVLLIVRSREGIFHSAEKPIYALFMYINGEENARQHLRMAAQLAVCVDAEDFIEHWCSVKNEQSLKEILLRDERFISLKLRMDAPSKEFIGKALSEVKLPKSTLVVLIRREHRTLIPHGSTVLLERDRLTIIGGPKDIRTLYRQYIGV